MKITWPNNCAYKYTEWKYMDSALISNKILVPFTLSQSGPAKPVAQGVIIYTNTNADKIPVQQWLHCKNKMLKELLRQ